MVSSTVEIFTLLFFVKVISSTGVFRFDPKAKRGTAIYYLYLEEQSQCLRACYDESKCKVVEYNETNGFCRLYKEGTNGTVKGYELTRDETDSSCMTETSTSDIAFQKILPLQENAIIPKSLAMSDLTVIKPFEGNERYRFFFTTSKTPSDWIATRPWLALSKKAEKSCAYVPVFHKADHRRLFFGEIYNTTDYYFFDGYAFAGKCVSSKSECLGMSEIQEYEDEHGNFFYNQPGRHVLNKSDLTQIFYIAGIA